MSPLRGRDHLQSLELLDIVCLPKIQGFAVLALDDFLSFSESVRAMFEGTQFWVSEQMDWKPFRKPGANRT